MDKQEEKFAKALREAQIETGKNITPKDAFVIWNDCQYDEICGFKVLYCPTISKCTLAFVDEKDSYNKLVRTFEEYME